MSRKKWEVRKLKERENQWRAVTEVLRTCAVEEKNKYCKVPFLI